MSTGVWVAICIVVAVVAAVLVFLLTNWGFLPKERSLPELPPTAETFLPAREIKAEDVEGLRFHTERRGYNRQEVDWALAQIAADYAAREGISVHPLSSKLPPTIGEHGINEG